MSEKIFEGNVIAISDYRSTLTKEERRLLNRQTLRNEVNARRDRAGLIGKLYRLIEMGPLAFSFPASAIPVVVDYSQEVVFTNVIDLPVSDPDGVA